MASIQLTSDSGKVEAYPVSKHARMGTLPRHFGPHMMTVEGRVFDLMRGSAAPTTAGLLAVLRAQQWRVLHGAASGTVRLFVPDNGYRGEMTSDAAGITISLFALSHLSYEYAQTEVFARHFHRLRDFALGHAEAREIFAAID